MLRNWMLHVQHYAPWLAVLLGLLHPVLHQFEGGSVDVLIAALWRVGD